MCEQIYRAERLLGGMTVYVCACVSVCTSKCVVPSVLASTGQGDGWRPTTTASPPSVLYMQVCV